MNITVVDEKGSEIKETPVSSEVKNSSDAPFDLARMEVLNMLGLKDGEESESVDTLIKWAKANTDDHSPEGLKWAIRSIETKTGTPPLGEKATRFGYTTYLLLEL